MTEMRQGQMIQDSQLLSERLQEETHRRKMAEEAHRKSSERFQTVVANTPVIIYALDENGMFTISEGLGLGKLGLRPGEVVGMSAFDIYRDYPDILDAIRRALSGEVVFFEHSVGDLRLDNRMVPVSDAAGRVTGIIGAALDITERAQAEAALRQEQVFLDAVMESVPGLLYLYDAEGRLIRWNKAHERETGYNVEELSRMTLLDWYPGDPEAQALILKEAQKALAGGFADAEANLRRKDGTTIPLYLTAVGVEIDHKPYITGIGIDITKRIEAEQALREANRNLEQKVADRTQELSSANDELTAMNEEMLAINEELQDTNERMQIEIDERHRAEDGLKAAIEELKTMQGYLIQSEKMAALGNLVAGIAHEINTPVGVGVTAASHLQEITEQFTTACKVGVPDSQKLNDYLEDLGEATEILLKNLVRASKLIKSFKQVSVDQSSELKRKFNVHRYLDEIILSMSPNLRRNRHQVTIQCDEALEIDGYPGAFAQIITNLLMNSVTHAYLPEDSGVMTIAVSKEEDWLSICYSDDGRGIEPHILPRIFDPFYTTRRGVGGTGLGLFVVYNIIKNQFQGTIQCESHPRKGTAFHIRLWVGEANHENI